MSYVDGFVFPVPKKNIASYKRMALMGRKAWMDAGALHYFECVGDDVHPQMGALGFPKMMKLKPSETVMFAFIVFKSKAHRNKVNAAVMKGFATMTPPPSMPFDPKKMAYGGFKTIVSSPV
jgi:uncharacterized protein YbaA (DUF1428 family)